MLSPGAVAIDGRDIVAVDTPDAIAARFSGRDTIDTSGSGRHARPDQHPHACAMVLYRGLADDLALMDWLQKYIFPAEAKTVYPEFVRAGTRLAALEMIESGTTTYADMYYFEEEIAKVTREAGLRGVLGQTIIQFPVADAKTPPKGWPHRDVHQAVRRRRPDRASRRSALDVHARHRDAQGGAGAGGSGARARPDPSVGDSGRGEDVENRRTKPRLHGYLETLGFWGPRTVAAHGVWLTPADMSILARHHVAVSHNPESNMKLASGAARVTAMRTARHRRRAWAPTGRRATTTSTCSRRCVRRRFLPSCRRATLVPFRRGSRCRWRRSMAPARSGWNGRLARSRRASAPT